MFTWVNGLVFGLLLHVAAGKIMEMLIVV